MSFEKVWFMLLVLFSVYVFCILQDTYGLDLLEEKRKLQVGESIVVEFMEGVDLTVSRKGIVDIRYIEQGKWQITGLKGGFVIVEAQDFEANYNKRVFIDVINPRAISKSEIKNMNLNEQIQEVCNKEGIECSSDVISGTTQSFMLWAKARRLCSQKEGCIFFLKLGALGKKDFIDIFKPKLGKKFDVKVTDFGTPVILALCDTKDNKITTIKQIADDLTDGLITSLGIPVICNHVINDDMLVLKSKIILTQTENADDLGLSTNFTSPFSITKDKIKEKLILNLHSTSMNKNIKIIGEPSLVLSLGKEGYVHTGSEIQVMYHTDKGDDAKKEGWKKSGVELKAKIENIIYDQYELYYELSIKHKNSHMLWDNSTSFNVSLISSVIKLKLDEPTIVGGADVYSENDAFSANLSLKDIPIVGPIFRLNHKQNSKSKLYVCLTLSKLSLLNQ